MCVGFVAALVFAHIRLVGAMDEGVFLAVGTVGEATVAAGEATFEGFLACKKENKWSKFSKIIDEITL